MTQKEPTTQTPTVTPARRLGRKVGALSAQLSWIAAAILLVFDIPDSPEFVIVALLATIFTIPAIATCFMLIGAFLHDIEIGEPWNEAASKGLPHSGLDIAFLANALAAVAFGYSGYPILAAIIAWLTFGGVAVDVQTYVQRPDFRRDQIGFGSWCIYTLVRCILLAAWYTFIFPILLPLVAFEWYWRRGVSQRMRMAFGKPQGLIYFVYSEPHQYDHFLGPGGVLHDVADPVCPRDWREEVTPERQDLGRRCFNRTPEGQLLKLHEITNLHDDLPFIVVVTATNELHPFQCSEAYRARKKDRTALREMEDQIRICVRNAFPD